MKLSSLQSSNLRGKYVAEFIGAFAIFTVGFVHNDRYI